MTGADRAGAGSGATIDFLESEFSLASVRWIRLDISRVVTRGTWVEKPDLATSRRWASLICSRAPATGGAAS